MIDIYLQNFFDCFKLSNSNGFEAFLEFRARYLVFLVGLQVETKLQLLHDDVPKFLLVTCSCLCIVVCVMLRVSYEVIQGVISDSFSNFSKVRHFSEVALG